MPLPLGLRKELRRVDHDGPVIEFVRNRIDLRDRYTQSARGQEVPIPVRAVAPASYEKLPERAGFLCGGFTSPAIPEMMADWSRMGMSESVSRQIGIG
jgi:hypothetical protein